MTDPTPGCFSRSARSVVHGALRQLASALETSSLRKNCISTRSRKIFWLLSAIWITNSPPPNMPRVIAVVMIIATVMVRLRRKPLKTSLKMN